LLKTVENSPKMTQPAATVCDGLEIIQSKGWGVTLEDVRMAAKLRQVIEDTEVKHSLENL
jgi:hypothetical protein